MTGLTIVLIATDPVRVRAALTLAISQVALGGRVRLYAHEHAVSMLVPGADGDNLLLADAGLPDRQALLAMAVDAGVSLIACQTGLALCGLGIDNLVAGAEAGGLMSALADLNNDRLVTI
jgi:predicted peroxiredoxin